MRRLAKFLAYLIALGIVALAVYAIFAELPAPVREVVVSVPLPALD